MLTIASVRLLCRAWHQIARSCIGHRLTLARLEMAAQLAAFPATAELVLHRAAKYYVVSATVPAATVRSVRGLQALTEMSRACSNCRRWTPQSAMTSP